MTELITDPIICRMIAGLAVLLAAFPVLYIVEALGRDALDSTPQPESAVEGWPAKYPSDLDDSPVSRLRTAAYLNHDECPTCERHFDWLADPYLAQATQWLEEIKVDIRDALPAGAR